MDRVAKACVHTRCGFPLQTKSGYLLAKYESSAHARIGHSAGGTRPAASQWWASSGSISLDRGPNRSHDSYSRRPSSLMRAAFAVKFFFELLVNWESSIKACLLPFSSTVNLQNSCLFWRCLEPSLLPWRKIRTWAVILIVPYEAIYLYKEPRGTRTSGSRSRPRLGRIPGTSDLLTISGNTSSMSPQAKASSNMNEVAVSNTIQPVDTSSTCMIDELVKPSTETDHVDTGLYAYTQALELDPDHLEQLAIRVRRKLDFILLPLV